MVTSKVLNLPVAELTEQSVEGFFVEQGINDNRTRIKILNEYMGAVDFSDSFGGEEAMGDFENTEMMYAVTKEILLGKKWLIFNPRE